jgi:hypothetical protein
MSGTDSLIGQTISHYSIIESSAVEAWVWCIRLRTRGSIALWV